VVQRSSPLVTLYNPRTSLPARRRTRWSDAEWRLPSSLPLAKVIWN
jgi:hypothetical protein